MATEEKGVEEVLAIDVAEGDGRITVVGKPFEVLAVVDGVEGWEDCILEE